jgi:hypothetical protein
MVDNSSEYRKYGDFQDAPPGQFNLLDRFANWFECIFPELGAILLLFLIEPRLQLDCVEDCWLLVAAIFLTRFTWNSATLIHGFGHSIARAIIETRPTALSISNIIENRNPIEFLRSFLPLNSTFVPGLTQEFSLWIEAGDATPWKIRSKAAGGLLFNLIAVLLGLLYFHQIDRSTAAFNFITTYSATAFICANLLILVSSGSDMVAVVTGEADRFYCGNFGFIGFQQSIAARDLFPSNLLELSKQKCGANRPVAA